MAIIGTLETLLKQADQSLFEKALNFLQKTDIDKVFKDVTIGNPIEIEIDGKDVFAIFQTYETKPFEDAKMEGHKKYIDIQYLHNGSEQILVTPKERMIKDDTYDETRDVYFPMVADYSTFRMNAGNGCILYPEDLHAPGIRIDAPAKVEKIVFKVAVK
ncbi:YhcH/YjgK/YiaL family protein [Carboxylicivirga linearis]|uniref:YhcH/YjgK/YiaL family protein n=1 Tax=Carboxylicivirga linearis TaxID=1628157 RepID=A0ABS5JUJ7_9BACT|nr:YhcH/YjgK/YiaL family protein [Carboxylicivirga linearis]MBS2098571.1 YhcH/YjgK/YiaL family protein [Carboxylicivirga linearis]